MKIIWMWPSSRRKLIERTGKYDAYRRVVVWGSHLPKNKDKDSGTTLWFATIKAEGHLHFLQTHKYRYDYVRGFVLNDGYYGEPKP